MRVLFPDLAFPGQSDLELSRLPQGYVGRCFWARKAAEIPAEEWAACDGVVFNNTFPLDRAIIGQLMKCKIIAAAAIGTDYIDIEACNERSIAVEHKVTRPDVQCLSLGAQDARAA